MASKAASGGGGGSASSGSRCTRPDCTALREELELVRGDLLELEGENEQLHEQVAALEGDRTDLSARLTRELAAKDEEIRRLEGVARDATAKLTAATASTTQAEGSAAKQSKTTTPGDATAALEQTCAELRGKNAALEAKLTELRASVTREASAGSAASAEVARVAQESRDKRSELYKALKENELLRSDVVSLQAALQQAGETTQAYETSIRGLHAQLEDYRTAVDEQTLEITQLHTKMDQLEREKADVEAKLIEMDEREADVEAVVHKTRTTFDVEKAAMQTELERMRDQLQQMQRVQDNIEQNQKAAGAETTGAARPRAATSARGGVAPSTGGGAPDSEMAKQLELLQELRIRDKSTIMELNQRILQQQSDLESLTEHLEALEADTVSRAVSTAVQSESVKHAATQQENIKLLRRLKEQGDLVREMEARQGVLEHQLNESQAWNAKYERNAGLEDVMKYQKQLRKELEKQQQANVQLRHELNEQIEAASRLHMSFERLKEETGRPASFVYDDLVIAEHLKGQLAIQGAVAAQLEQQVHELEAERVRLLQRLKDQARLTGNKLYESHGLTIEQWSLVEEFIDQVKRTPEVAKRVLVTGNVPASRKEARGAEISASTSKPAADSEMEAELAKTYAENVRLLNEISQLRNEVGVARAQAAVVSVAVQPAARDHSDQQQADVSSVPAVQRQDVEARDQEINKLHAQLTELRFECDQLTKERDSAVSQAIAQSSADTGKSSQQQDGGKAQTHEREKRSKGVDKASSPPRPAVVSTCGTQTIASASTRHTDTPSTRTESAESIAQTVVKALEAQLTLLKASSTTPTRSVEKPTPDSSGKNADAVPIARTTPGTSTSSSKMPTGTSTPLETELAVKTEAEIVQQVDYLKELNVCLDELTQSEARHDVLTRQLEEHEQAFSSLMDQHTLLYQHFFHMHSQYSATEANQRRELEQLRAANREFELKCQRYEAGLHAIGAPLENGALPAPSLLVPTEDQLRAQVSHLTRQTAVFEVNEARMKRQYQQLQMELKTSTRRNILLEEEWLEMEKSLKFRVLYLESWKQGADDMMERMDKMLAMSVLKPVADRQQRALQDVLARYHDVSSAYNDVRVKYLKLYDMPVQLSRAQHRVELLEAERRARDLTGGSGGNGKASKDGTKQPSGDGGAGVTSDTRLLKDRITQLEQELQVQLARVKELEEQRSKQDTSSLMTKAIATLDAEHPGAHGDSDHGLAAENALLYDRINEVEQLYDALARECAKYKDVASLAASQANVLTTKLKVAHADDQDDGERRRQLAAASEDHALVGQLQHELMAMRATYQQFAIRYDGAVTRQQQAELARQQLELAVEHKAKALADTQDASRERVAVLEATISQVKTRDLTARNAKWDAFRKRLDALDDDLRAEHARRQQLEQELEAKQAELGMSAGGASRAGAGPALAEVSRLRSRVEALEDRERVLMGQLEAAARSLGAQEREEMLQAELADAKTLNEDLVRQVRAVQERAKTLLAQVGEQERQVRELRGQKEDVELELRHLQEEFALHEYNGDNQSESRNHPESRSPTRMKSGSGSPLMRQKVGLYERDQAQLQQAAQATIASLKQLVEEKNALVGEYQGQLAALRTDVARAKAQDRATTAQTHKALYEENQRVLSQLQEATATIQQLERSGKEKKALQAAQARHEHALREWKAAELSREEAQQKVRELQQSLEVVTNERDVAEARAGEALEEMVVLQSQVEAAVKQTRQLETQVSAARGDLRGKDAKLQLLRDAIVKLKEEFLKAEDRHAVELAKAQHALQSAAMRAQTKKKKEEEQEEAEAWKDEKERFESQVKMLQEKLALQRKQLATARKKVSSKQTARGDSDDSKPYDSKGAEKDVRAAAAAAAGELERLKQKLKEQAVGEARAVAELEQKVKVLQAQNLALREASRPLAAIVKAGAEADGESEADKRERRSHVELERKLQRRVEMLTSRLKEQQDARIALDQELAAARDRIAHLEETVRRHQRQTDTKVDAKWKKTAAELNEWQARATELERQNAFLQETLALKRREWEDTAREQIEQYEARFGRLWTRLVRLGVVSAHDNPDGDDDDDDGALVREESRAVISQSLHDEMNALNAELLDAEQQAAVKDSRLLELELEVETLRIECQRLQRMPASSPSGAAAGRSKGGTPITRTVRGGAAGVGWKERAELEDVIENMKKVIEKLRAENARLRQASTASVTPDKLAKMRRRVRELTDARQQMEEQVAALERDVSDLRQDKSRLQTKWRQAATASADKERSLKSAQTEITRLEAVVQMFRQRQEQPQSDDRHSAGIDAEQVEQYERQIHTLEEQVAALEDENARLARELAAFDDEFFEEIEDLKYKYAQAVRAKRTLEARLRSQGVERT